MNFFRSDASHKLCVHIRRTDFFDTHSLLPSDEYFTKMAIAYVTAKIAVIISNFYINDDFF